MYVSLGKMQKVNNRYLDTMISLQKWVHGCIADLYYYAVPKHARMVNKSVTRKHDCEQLHGELYHLCGTYTCIDEELRGQGV